MSRRIFLSTNCHFVENYVFNYCEQMMKHVIKTAQEILRSFFPTNSLPAIFLSELNFSNKRKVSKR